MGSFAARTLNGPGLFSTCTLALRNRRDELGVVASGGLGRMYTLALLPLPAAALSPGCNSWPLSPPATLPASANKDSSTRQVLRGVVRQKSLLLHLCATTGAPDFAPVLPRTPYGSGPQLLVMLSPRHTLNTVHFPPNPLGTVGGISTGPARHATLATVGLKQSIKEKPSRGENEYNYNMKHEEIVDRETIIRLTW